jgi:hypothetical protein
MIVLKKILKLVRRCNLKHIGIPLPQNKNKKTKKQRKERERQRFRRRNINTKRTEKDVRRTHERRRKMDTEKLSSAETCMLIELRGEMSIEDETGKEHAVSQNSTVNYKDLST